jgi:hypothetical protein
MTICSAQVFWCCLWLTACCAQVFWCCMWMMASCCAQVFWCSMWMMACCAQSFLMFYVDGVACCAQVFWCCLWMMACSAQVLFMLYYLTRPPPNTLKNNNSDKVFTHVRNVIANACLNLMPQSTSRMFSVYSNGTLSSGIYPILHKWWHIPRKTKYPFQWAIWIASPPFSISTCRVSPGGKKMEKKISSSPFFPQGLDGLRLEWGVT